MSHEKYTLEVISHHPQFANKSLRKYMVDGIETVGAWGDENFEIRFRNNTSQKIQVKISLDGTDILSGKPADTEVSTKDMWVVNGYDTLSLKAWPENSNGGAGFVFTSANNSVAVHTHGDMSSRGIIAVAVFVEGHVEPIRYNVSIVVKEHHYHSYPTYPTYPYYYYPPDTIYTSPIWVGGNYFGSGGITYTTNNSSTIVPQSVDGSAYNSCNFISPTASRSETFSSTLDSLEEISDSRGLESLVAIGAGEHVNQKITYVAGLIKPMFSETIRVKYIWWDELVAKLRTQTVAQAQPSGFPGDGNKKNIDLKGTPRIKGDKGTFRRSEPQMFSRV